MTHWPPVDDEGRMRWPTFAGCLLISFAIGLAPVNFDFASGALWGFAMFYRRLP